MTFDGIAFYDLTFGLGALVILLYALRLNRTDPAFKLKDLVTGDNGLLSNAKTASFGAWYCSTWGFVALIKSNQLSEWYFAGYMIAFAGLSVAGKLASNRDPNVTTSTMTSTTTHAPKSVAVVVPVVAPVAAEALAPKAAATVDQEALEIEAAAQRIQEATK